MQFIELTPEEELAWAVHLCQPIKRSRGQPKKMVGLTYADSNGIGKMDWMIAHTGWSHDKISRLCRLRLIKGAFKSQLGVKGAMWNFHKAKVLEWLDGLENGKVSKVSA